MSLDYVYGIVYVGTFTIASVHRSFVAFYSDFRAHMFQSFTMTSICRRFEAFFLKRKLAFHHDVRVWTIRGVLLRHLCADVIVTRKETRYRVHRKTKNGPRARKHVIVLISSLHTSSKAL